MQINLSGLGVAGKTYTGRGSGSNLVWNRCKGVTRLFDTYRTPRGLNDLGPRLPKIGSDHFLAGRHSRNDLGVENEL